MGLILSFVSIKGGVGKTTLAIEVASCLANKFGKKVLLIDGNFSSPNLALYFGLTPIYTIKDLFYGEMIQNAILESNNIDIVPGSFSPFHPRLDLLKGIMDKYKERYDFIIIDSSPHYSELDYTLALSDRVFVVTSPDNMTLQTSIQAAEQAKKSNIPIDGIIINRIAHPNFELNLKEIENFTNLPVLARIRDDKKFIEAKYLQKPLGIHSINSKSAKEIEKFSAFLAGVPENKGFWEKIIGSFNKEVINRELVREKFYEPYWK